MCVHAWQEGPRLCNAHHAEKKPWNKNEKSSRFVVCVCVSADTQHTDWALDCSVHQPGLRGNAKIGNHFLGTQLHDSAHHLAIHCNLTKYTACSVGLTDLKLLYCGILFGKKNRNCFSKHTHFSSDYVHTCVFSIITITYILLKIYQGGRRNSRINCCYQTANPHQEEQPQNLTLLSSR